MPRRKPPESVDFEKALQELEALVERLEGGDLPLEEALSEFERGVGLTRSCQTALQQAEQKVKRLTEEGEEQDLEPPAEAKP